MAEEIRALLGRRRRRDIWLARAIGRSHTYIYRRLNGETAFDVDDLYRIAEALGVEAWELLPKRDASAAPEFNGHYVPEVTAAYTPQPQLLAKLQAVTLSDEGLDQIRHGDGRRKPDGRPVHARASPLSN